MSSMVNYQLQLNLAVTTILNVCLHADGDVSKQQAN